ncbi:GGDEF domain-containing protein [Roseateles chitosanitabidus]|uniref:GGDEF domain-containing protein n=1 Tax=Roseateles chitosanitabidus TaxID=65048 RepID=UPI00082FAD97|nr:diguanylate cyclase [Roseateles chitosanitabidus]
MPDPSLSFERDLRADPDIARLMGTLSLDHVQARALLTEEVAEYARAGRRLHLAYALALLARVHALQGDGEAADATARQARQLFKEEGAPSGEALVLHSMAIRHLVGGRQAQALEDLNRALPLARGSGWPDVQACVHNILGVVLNDMGRHDEAARTLREALELPAPTLSRSLSLRLHGNLALALARGAQRAKQRQDGDWRSRADEAVEEARHVSRHVDELLPGDRAAFLDTLATALVAQGALDEAHLALDEAQATFDADGDDLGLLYTSLTRSRAWLESHEPAKALQALSRGREAAARSGATVLLDELELQASIAHEQLGDYRAALAAHQAFYRWRETQVLALAEERARSLAVTLDFDRAHRESRHDALTGLLNRRGFDELFERVLGRAGLNAGVGLALIDLDHFKQVNDRFGHAAGDDALRLVAKLLTSECRATDFAARLGGDEFVLVVQGDRGTAAAVCGRVLERLRAQGHDPGTGGPALTISAGVAETDRPEAPATMLARADEALYRVKAAGRDGVQVG